jgi:transposase
VNLEEALAAALAQVASLTAQLAAEREAAAAERAQLHARIDELLRKVDELLARKKKAAPPADPTPSPGPQVAPAPPGLENRPQPPAKSPDVDEEKGRKPRVAKVRPELPTIEDPPIRPDRCGHCGGSRLVSKDVQEIVLIDHVRGYVRRRVVRRIRCRCADCAKETTPPAPLACLPRTHFTAAFVAFVLYSKLAMHLPWERTRTDLEQQGYAIPSSTLNSVAQRALEMLAIIAKVLWRRLMAGDYAQSDATGLSVITPGRDHVHHGQMFVFCWGKLVVFRYQPNKEGATFKRMVEGFRGTLVLDASSTHNEALELPGVLWAGCNAHGLRKFRDAVEADPVLAPEGERWVAAMFDKDREGREKHGLSGAALLAWRQAEIAPLAAQFKRWIAAVHPTTLPKTPLREATAYYADYWRPMTRFLRDPNLPMDNNFSERSLRAEAVGRSNWIYAGSAQAAENLAVGYTLVQTAKAEGVDVLDYLSWALERVRHCGDSLDLAAKLTPAAYKEAQKARDR